MAVYNIVNVYKHVVVWRCAIRKPFASPFDEYNLFDETRQVHAFAVVFVQYEPFDVGVENASATRLGAATASV